MHLMKCLKLTQIIVVYTSTLKFLQFGQCSHLDSTLTQFYLFDFTLNYPTRVELNRVEYVVVCISNVQQHLKFDSQKL